jgi:prepilin-type N-terminal cleavage/methylation domain-containing protein
MRRFIKHEQGFTLIEVMVAALLLVVAFTALATVFISGQSQASANVQQAQLINVADQQLEQIRSAVTNRGFAALGMNTAPTRLSSRVVRNTFFDPDSFVVSGANASSCLLVATNYDSVTTGAAAATPAYGVTAPAGFVQWSTCNSTASTSTNAEPLQVFAAGAASPTPIVTVSSALPQCTTGSGGAITVPCWVPLTSGCTSAATTITTVPSCAATVYAFVTDTFIGCGTSGGVTCPSTGSSGVVQCPTASLPTLTTGSTTCADARRVIVAVVPNPPNQSSPNVSHQLARVTPVYLSTIFTNPTPSGTSSGSAGLALNLSLL